MKRLTPDSPELKSADLVAENIERLRELFPEAFANEGKIDFDVLRQLLGDRVDDGEERYGLNWHGKRAARQLALTPSTGTLRPIPEESVDWETTKNIFIEGDNLEVLKLLQKSYTGKVKLIYIDPPYNTGKDFVYPDNFQDSIKNYLEITGQIEGGQRVASNTEAGGRFHTDWLNMMYPRLKLARTLLEPDGVLWVSIDDNELHNLKAICDSVFGEENFVGVFVWEKRTTRENRKVFSVNHDYIVCYAREKPEFELSRGLLPRSDESEGRFANPDDDPRGPWQSVSLNAQAGPGRRKQQFYTITTPSGRTVDPPSGRCWIYTESRFQELVSDKRIWFGEDGANVPRLKSFRSESDDGVTPHTLWRADEVGTTDTAKKAIKDLFDGIEVFDTPKPIGLLQRIVQISTRPNDHNLVVDFFAGPASIGEAVLQQNIQDSGNRRVVMVQLPEPLPDDSPARQLGFKTLSEVAVNRTLRVGKKGREENPLFDGDLGFRVFKLDAGNVRPWKASTETLAEALTASIDHVKPDRTEYDLLYEIILKHGLDLCVAIEEKRIGSHKICSVGGGAVFTCFGSRIAAADVEQLADGIAKWRDELTPANSELSRVIFRDSAFETDVAKTNLAAILKQRGFDERMIVSL